MDGFTLRFNVFSNYDLMSMKYVSSWSRSDTEAMNT
jgi:hypothetical protein